MADNQSEKNKTVTITVNGRPAEVQKGLLTFEALVAIRFPNPNFDNTTYKVTYYRSEKQEDKDHELTLAKGQSVEVVDGMIFTVVPTGLS